MYLHTAIMVKVNLLTFIYLFIYLFVFLTFVCYNFTHYLTINKKLFIIHGDMYNPSPKINAYLSVTKLFNWYEAEYINLLF